MTKKHKNVLSILMALVLLVTCTASFPLNSTAEAYDTQESAVSSENLSAQIENTVPTTAGIGYMERVDEFPFEFEIIAIDGRYVTARFKVKITDLNLGSRSSASEYEFHTDAEEVSGESPVAAKHIFRMEAERLYSFEYSYNENGGKVYYNGNIEALCLEVNGEPYASVKIYNTVKNVFTEEEMAILNGSISVEDLEPIRGVRAVDTEPNDTMATATAAGLGINNTGLISTLSDVDYWVVSFSSSGTATFVLTNGSNMGNLCLFLYNSSGTLLSSSMLAGTMNETISYSVSANTNYYIKVNAISGPAPISYMFRADFVSAPVTYTPDSYEPNNGINSASLISVGATYANIHASNDIDYYKVNIAQESSVNVGLSNIPVNCDYDLYVYNAASASIGISANSGIAAEGVTLNSYTGWLYIAVIPKNSTYSGNNYYLYVGATAIEPEEPDPPIAGDSYEPNNSIGTQITIGTTITANIHEAGDIDNYTFQVTQSGTLNISLTNIPAGCDYDISLMRGALPIAYTNNTGNASENLTYACETSSLVYTLCVSAKNNGYSANNYTLTVTFTPLFVWPTTSRRITQHYSSSHLGVDVGPVTPGVAGDDIYAFYNGNLYRYSYDPKAGHTARTNHFINGRYYGAKYEHMTDPTLVTGHVISGPVFAGTKIGEMNTTGTDSTGVHLHFELRVKDDEYNYNSDWYAGDPVDPAIFFPDILVNINSISNSGFYYDPDPFATEKSFTEAVYLTHNGRDYDVRWIVNMSESEREKYNITDEVIEKALKVIRE